MATESPTASDPLRQLTAPMALLVAIVVAVAWYVAWASADSLAMGAVGMGLDLGPPGIVAFYGLLVVMMVAMMLPSALPMILAYRAITRLEAGRPTRPPDNPGTALFVLPYFLLWGAFSVVALLGLVALGLVGPFVGSIAFVPAAVLLAAGAYQATRTKEVCLAHCQSPMSFVMQHWRSGRAGAARMGVRHAMYCIGCCWLFMLVLFVAGAMSLVWMGALSLAIFAEKVGTRPRATSFAIGAILLALGGVLAVRAVVSG
ncbi:MAG: DUF2182 domain-containing protein [Methanobacteriota archaeon]